MVSLIHKVLVLPYELWLHYKLFHNVIKLSYNNLLNYVKNQFWENYIMNILLQY